MKRSSPTLIELVGGPWDGDAIRYESDAGLYHGAELLMQWVVDPSMRYLYHFDGAKWRYVRCWPEAEKQVESGMPWGGSE